MDKLLRPKEFDKDPLSPSCSRDWIHWKVMFNKFISKVDNITEEGKLDLLTCHVSPSVYSYMADSTTYTNAMECLDKVFKPKKSVLYCRHVMLNCKQESSESVHLYFQRLKSLVRDCDYKAATKAVHENEAMRDAFISGIHSAEIRQKLLESDNHELTAIYELASSLEQARSQSQAFSQSYPVNAIPTDVHSEEMNSEDFDETAAAMVSGKAKGKWSACYYCGSKDRHPRRSACPAFNAVCHDCGEKGHYQKFCRDNNGRNKSRKTNQASAIHFVAASPPSLSKSIQKIVVNGTELDALIDSGSSITLLNHDVAVRQGWKIIKSASAESVSMASSSHVSKSSGSCSVEMYLLNDHLVDQKVIVMKDLCADIIIGLDILSEYSSITLAFGGNKEPAVLSCAATVEPPLLFGDLDPSCKPIKVKSRRYTDSDKKFIKSEIDRLSKEGKIEECRSPWRAQCFVHKGDEFHKPRLVIDYSQTINRFTGLDAFPVPLIDEMVEDLSKKRFYTTFDLTAAYHQVPILEHERKFTAFEACGKLYQFKYIPFGVTNGVSAFQRTVQNIKDNEKLEDVYIYLDNMTIAGDTKEDHDQKVKAFEAAAAKYNLSFNDSKTIRGVESINLLGYLVSHNSVKPDPERLAPLLNMLPPTDDKSLSRVLGMFAHYSKWVKNFSEKIRPLSHSTEFPLADEAVSAFNGIKEEIAQSVLATPNPALPFIVETDASKYAIGATLSQSGQPVAFFSRTLN